MLWEDIVSEHLCSQFWLLCQKGRPLCLEKCCIDPVTIPGTTKWQSIWPIILPVFNFNFLVEVTEVSALLCICVVSSWSQPGHKLFLFMGLHKKSNLFTILKDSLPVCGGVRVYIPRCTNSHPTAPMNIS